MRTNQLCQRPSALPAAVGFRVSALLSEASGLIGPRYRVADRYGSYPGGPIGSYPAVAALHAAGRLADGPTGSQWTGMGMAIPVSPGNVTQQEQKQVNAGRTHLTTAVGGAPPRGRPN